MEMFFTVDFASVFGVWEACEPNQSLHKHPRSWKIELNAHFKVEFKPNTHFLKNDPLLTCLHCAILHCVYLPFFGLLQLLDPEAPAPLHQWAAAAREKREHWQWLGHWSLWVTSGLPQFPVVVKHFMTQESLSCRITWPGPEWTKNEAYRYFFYFFYTG